MRAMAVITVYDGFLCSMSHTLIVLLAHLPQREKSRSVGLRSSKAQIMKSMRQNRRRNPARERDSQMK